MTQQPSTPAKVGLKAVTPGHLIISTIVTALIAAGDAGLQYFQTNGAQFSLVQLIGAVLVALLATLGTGVITLEKNPTIEQAIDGAIGPHVNALSSLVAQHASTVNQIGSLAAYLVRALEQQHALPQAPQTPVQAPVTSAPPQAAQPMPAVPQQQFKPLPMPGMTQYAPLPDVSMPLVAIPPTQSGQPTQ